MLTVAQTDVVCIWAFCLGFCLGVLAFGFWIDNPRLKSCQKQLTAAQAELADVKKELSLCEAEISHLVAKRDSRGRFTK
jgi:hypothetical protein